jgi:LysM repeat protein
MRRVRLCLAILTVCGLLLGATSVGATATEDASYTVVRGDTLTAIGARYGVRWQDIATANHIPNPNLIHIGDILTIPGATAGATAQAPVVAPVAAPEERDDSIEGIIVAAAYRYGQDPQVLLRVAWCESRYDPNAYNAQYGATGLFQFLYSTWLTTPYRDYDRRNAWASANAAAWMFSQGRAREWVCY